jgi:hypothetical protein
MPPWIPRGPSAAARSPSTCLPVIGAQMPAEGQRSHMSGSARDNTPFLLPIGASMSDRAHTGFIGV